MHKNQPYAGNFSQAEPDSAKATASARSQVNPKDAAAPFQSPTLVESLGQFASSFGGFLCACAAMYLTVGILRWFTGNIGFHHIHHLNPRIPNYRLQECHDANPMLQTAPVLTLWSGLKQVRFALWDAERGRMVSCRSVRHRMRDSSA